MKNVKYLFLLLALLACAAPMFAQGQSNVARTSTDWVALTSGFAMAIASGLCALGQGKAIAGAAEGVARNPAAAASIRFFLILGLVLIESLALYVLAIIFVKVVP